MTGFGTLPDDLARGAALGLAVAAPIGPTAMLCIRSTLAGGRLQGLLTGCGAATTHMAYALAASLGMAVVLAAARDLRAVLDVCCAGFLMHLAVRTARRRPELPGVPARCRRLWPAYLLGLSWTFANPVTILSFASLTPGLLDGGAVGRSPPAVALGVLLGSTAWWLALTTLVGFAWSRMSMAGLRRANLAAGIVLAGLAVVTLARAVGSWR